MVCVNAVLVANAPLRWSLRSTELARGAAPLLAADGGANHLARIGLRPAAVIGDLDSISPSTRAWVGEDRMVHRPRQDRTDLDKALEFALEELGFERLTVLAALGGRPDHFLGNLGLLARLGMNERLIYQGDRWTVLAVSGEATLASVPGETWSFWTFDPAVRVSIEGVHWPLENDVMATGTTKWISNEAVADHVAVTATGGAVVVMRHQPPALERSNV